jgi:hypothetical protein
MGLKSSLKNNSGDDMEISDRKIPNVMEISSYILLFPQRRLLKLIGI